MKEGINCVYSNKKMKKKTKFLEMSKNRCFTLMSLFCYLFLYVNLKKIILMQNLRQVRSDSPFLIKLTDILLP